MSASDAIILANPDAVAYSKLVHQFLWQACAPVYITVIVSYAALKIVRSLFSVV